MTVGVAVEQELGRKQGDVVAMILGPMSDPECYEWHLPSRAKALRALEIRRRLITFSQETVRSAYSESDVDGVLAHTAAYAEMLDDLHAREETGELGDLADDLERRADSGEAGGWKTGIEDYDRWSGGLRPGEVHIVAGPSGAGKTWLLVEIANALSAQGRAVSIFSLEMGRDLMYVRLLSGIIGSVAFRLIGRGKTWTAKELAAYKAAKAQLIERELRVFNEQRSLDDITAVVRYYKPDVFLVDYAQLMDWPTDARSEYAAITANMNGLQRLAQKTGSCAVVASQMSRQALREGAAGIQGGLGSGRVDQVADFWLLVEQDGDMPGRLHLVNRKSRHGVTGGDAWYQLDMQNGGLRRA